MICPLCKSTCNRIKRKQITDKQLKRAYFFMEFDKCPNCDYIKLDNNYKVINKSSYYRQTKLL